jgi:hypothetical protein
MDGNALKFQLRETGFADYRAWLFVLVAAGWSVLVLGTVVDAPPLPHSYPGGPLFVLGVPAVLAAAVVFHRGAAGAPLKLAAAWTSVLAAALVAAVAVESQPLVAVAIPGVAASAFVLSRAPTLGVTLILLLSGTFGSLQAFVSFPAGELVDILLAGLWIGALLRYLAGGLEAQPLVLAGMAGVALYLSITLIQALAVSKVSTGLEAFRFTAWYLSAVLLIAYAGWRAATLQRIVRAIVLVALIVGAYATLRWIIGPAQDELEFASRGTAGRYNYTDGKLVLVGSFTSGHLLGAWTSAAIPFCVAFALTVSGWWRLVGVLASGLCVFALLGSQTRVGVIGAVAGLALVLVLYQFARGFPGLRLDVATAVVLAVVVGGGVLFSITTGTSGKLVDRYSQIGTGDHSYQVRLKKWKRTFREIRELPFGKGLSSGAGDPQRFYTSGLNGFDSSYVKIAYEQGVAVMVLFIATMLALLVGLARRALTTLDRHKAGVAIGACGTLLGYSITLVTDQYNTGLESLVAWVIVGIGVAQFSFRDRQAPEGASAEG